VIRQLRREDWKQLREVRLRALASDPSAFLETHAEASAFPDDLWQERATPSDDRVSFALESDGRFDGLVAAFSADDPGTAFLVGMWVAPTLRGTGAARGLVESVIGWARERGFGLVCLSVEPKNERAARLYERCGFTETSDPPPFPYRPNERDRFFVYEL
jgi:GNAT superfamily N-acetyltransferase